MTGPKNDKLKGKRQEGASRRDFLKLASAAPAAAAAAVASGGAASAAVEQPESSLGLRKTEHVRKYLDSARF